MTTDGYMTTRVSLHTGSPDGIESGDSTFISWSAGPPTITALVAPAGVLVKCVTCGEFVDMLIAHSVENPTGTDWFCANDK